MLRGSFTRWIFVPEPAVQDARSVNAHRRGTTFQRIPTRRRFDEHKEGIQLAHPCTEPYVSFLLFKRKLLALTAITRPLVPLPNVDRIKPAPRFWSFILW